MKGTEGGHQLMIGSLADCKTCKLENQSLCKEDKFEIIQVSVEILTINQIKVLFSKIE